MNESITTNNLADFGAREINILIDLLQAWQDHGLPEDFCDEQVHPMLNINSGNVFLTNKDCQVAMINGNKLEIWYSCPNCGHERFQETCKINDEGCNECIVKSNDIKN